MATRVAINGFGRIDRLALRAMPERHKRDLPIVAVNDMADLQTNAHLFRYDSTYDIYGGTVETGADVMKIDGRKITILNQKDPFRLPWSRHRYRVHRRLHRGRLGACNLVAGAKKAIVTAPATDDDLTIVLGVNNSAYNARKRHIVANASCTTDCLAPVTKALHRSFGIGGGQITTIHAYTNDQRILH